jgi:hypothetical protein
VGLNGPVGGVVGLDESAPAVLPHAQPVQRPDGARAVDGTAGPFSAAGAAAVVPQQAPARIAPATPSALRIMRCLLAEPAPHSLTRCGGRDKRKAPGRLVSYAPEQGFRVRSVPVRAFRMFVVSGTDIPGETSYGATTNGAP